jgi:putative addiction module killer protein
MNSPVQSSVFSEWLTALKDDIGKASILRRLANAELGNFGDVEPVGEGVSEMRIHGGPGYRVYFVRSGTVVYILLCGGMKSTQKRDIGTAKRVAKELRRQSR